MLPAFTALLLCQLAGEAVVRAASLPVPGPVVGMLLLFILMLTRTPLLPAGLNDTADTLLRHLSLLFVPAGVGVVQHLDRLGHDGLRLVAVIVLTTVIALAVTALTFAGIAHLMRVDEIAADHEGERAP